MVHIDFAISGRPVDNLFQLLGEDEDAITVSIAWALTRSPTFLANLVRRAGGEINEGAKVQLLVHRYEAGAGITDAELIIPGEFHMILEAKKGWILPGDTQLTKYSRRQSFITSKARVKKIVTLSECSNQSRVHLPFKEISGIAVQHISWSDIIVDATSPARTTGHIEKRVLSDLVKYLRTAMTQQDRYSNLVYVVSLGPGSRKGWTTTWIDVVKECKRYFHPLGGSGWPKVPPTYLGFRYHGQLQSIHFVEKYEVVEDLAVAFPKEGPTPVKPYYLYTLGLPIEPSRKVVNGNVYPSGRVWCAIDTLLTCDSVSQARCYESTWARCRATIVDRVDLTAIRDL